MIKKGVLSLSRCFLERGFVFRGWDTALSREGMGMGILMIDDNNAPISVIVCHT